MNKWGHPDIISISLLSFWTHSRTKYISGSTNHQFSRLKEFTEILAVFIVFEWTSTTTCSIRPNSWGNNILYIGCSVQPYKVLGGMEVVSRTFTAFDDWSLSQTPVGNCRTKSWLLEKASGYWQPIWLGLKRNYFIIKYLAIFFYLLACSLKNVVKNRNSFYLVYNIALHSIHIYMANFGHISFKNNLSDAY